MFRLSLLALTTALLAFCHVAEAVRKDQCSINVDKECGKAGSLWKEPAGCSAVYGGYQTNQKNLALLVKDHLQDSFKFLLMGTRFNRDNNNRVGLHGKLMGYSDDMWNDAVKMIKYMTKRGGNVAGIFQNALKLDNVQIDDFHGEVNALAIILDMFKSQASEVTKTIRQSMNKHHLPASMEAPYFDPSIYNFLESEYLAGYTEKIREVAGHLNILGKIAKNDKTMRMGLHLYDQSLKG